MSWFTARITWLSKPEGGRAFPPTGEEPPIYWAVVKFPNVTEGSSVSWSLWVRKIMSSEDGFTWDALVSFRVPDAPAERLCANQQFELFEGPHRVAIGVIAPDQNYRGESGVLKAIQGVRCQYGWIGVETLRVGSDLIFGFHGSDLMGQTSLSYKNEAIHRSDLMGQVGQVSLIEVTPRYTGAKRR